MCRGCPSNVAVRPWRLLLVLGCRCGTSPSETAGDSLPSGAEETRTKRVIPSSTCPVTIVAPLVYGHIPSPHPGHGFTTDVVTDPDGDDANPSQPPTVDRTGGGLIQESQVQGSSRIRCFPNSVYLLHSQISVASRRREPDKWRDLGWQCPWVWQQERRPFTWTRPRCVGSLRFQHLGPINESASTRYRRRTTEPLPQPQRHQPPPQEHTLSTAQGIPRLRQGRHLGSPYYALAQAVRSSHPIDNFQAKFP